MANGIQKSLFQWIGSKSNHTFFICFELEVRFCEQVHFDLIFIYLFT